MARLDLPRSVLKVLAAGAAGGAIGGVLFSDDDPTGEYRRRLERMDFTGVGVRRAGSSYAIDCQWPPYFPVLVTREYGNSYIVTEDGDFKSCTIRLPGFPEADFGYEYALGIAERVAHGHGLDRDSDTYINTWAPYYAPHINVQARDHPDFTMTDALDATKDVKDIIEDEVVDR